MKQFYKILTQLMVINRDDSYHFTDTRRLDEISELLKDSSYRLVNENGLFHMYSKKPIKEIDRPILVSTHVDCERSITKCFTEEVDGNTIRGVYDNGLTNSMMVYLMLKDVLPEDVVVAFTGDEEETGHGVRDVVRFFESLNRIPCMTVVLDATYEGWDEKVHFTIENNFWDKRMNDKMEKILSVISGKWLFVPSDPDDVPGFIDKSRLIDEEADEDESWAYDEEDWMAFSFCIPVDGEMHSNAGVLARKESCEVALSNLKQLLIAINEWL